MKGVLFTTDQAPGAIPNGTRVEKINSEPGDGHPDGTTGRVIGSVAVEDPRLPARYVYFVEWVDLPAVPVAVGDNRIREVE
ncbi:MAG: hypothetical protein ACE5JL_13425 [Dehalococcoidia bacterium]